jgi:hypothetical protein
VKVKVFDIGHFVVIGFTELGPGRLEAVHVADRAGFIRDGVLDPSHSGESLVLRLFAVPEYMQQRLVLRWSCRGIPGGIFRARRVVWGC